jgi:copper chaperone
MRQLTLHITGMTCGHCLHAVNEALITHPGTQLESLRMGRADLRYDESVTTPADIEAAVEQTGYPAKAVARDDAGARP